MKKITLWKRTLVAVVSTGLVAVQVPAVTASSSVFGTLKTSGATWVAADSAEWAQVSSSRPILAGDQIRTDDSGYALAQLGGLGTIGLEPGAQIRTSGSADAAVVGVEKGKVAFHLAEASGLQVAAAGATVKGAGEANGFVVVGDAGSTLTVERGTMQVAMATGGQRTVQAGETVALDGSDQVAGAYGEPEQPEELPAPPPPPPAPVVEEPKKRNMTAAWILGGTALAAIIAVVIAEAVDDDDNKAASPN